MLLVMSCSDNGVDDLSGASICDVQRFNFTEAASNETVKLQKGLKRLDINFSNNSGEKFNLLVMSREWSLAPGTYTVEGGLSEPGSNMTVFGSYVNGDNTEAFATGSGSLNVFKNGDEYIINGLLAKADKPEEKFIVNYRGPISFVIGVDDPEPSGYMVTVVKTQATVTDPVTYQPIPLEGLSKYTFTITDPEGASAGSIEAINATDIEMKGLAGDYKIQGSPDKAWLADNGWVVPDWGMAGGTYFVDNSGNKRYITDGTIKMEFVTGINGEQLINFSGDAMGSINANGTAADPYNLSIKFAQVLVNSGTEIRDLKIQSSVLNREMSYSVLLPDGFDGTRTYPVLYMLHGAYGNNNDWLQQGMVAAHIANAGCDMVIVFPNGSPDGFDSFYINNYQNKGLNYEDYFFTELVPTVEAMFKVKPGKENRGIAGLSMGGYGSLYYGLSHPDMFCYIYACSPATYVEGTPNIYDLMWTPGLPGITVEIGTSDFLYESSLGFKQALGYSQIDWDFIERDGAHDWAFWTACAPKILKKFAEIFTL